MNTFLSFFANLVYSIANNNVNFTCAGPMYQFEEPEQLKEVK